MKSVLLDLRTPSTSAATPSSMSVNEDNLEEEARDAVSSSRHPVNDIVLPPTAGDSGEGVSNTEYVPDEPEEELEPAGELEAEEEVDTEEVPIQHTSKNARVVTLLWKKSDQFDGRLPSPYISPSDQIQRFSELSAFEVWKEVFSDAMVEHIMKHTNLYARRDCNNKTFSASKKDIENFLGTVMLSEYHSLPHVQHYGSTQPDMGVPLVYNTMSRNCYMELKKYIHFSDNQKLTRDDKRTYSVWMKLWCHTSVAIVRRCSSGGSLFASAIRSGCGNDGDPYYMSIYQGKDEQASKEHLDARVLELQHRCCQILPLSKRSEGHLIAVAMARSTLPSGTTPPWEQ
ncbi:PiggyBac transposable element-derived protein 2 [Trichinella zimbabwensis]|uniref:PiggyBac transposable element-derived protein 2 n=1 Tax=Trichinella zimbabwensis TaxID=268475 RepID=A0A0V1GXK2_9BILA|nr:PiggyBac transposable element-derived protein 2 [Trichinella zimbabwensis]